MRKCEIRKRQLKTFEGKLGANEVKVKELNIQSE